ncbi:MAG TPA: alpha-L-arabinofuranosidase C-terminal domain-containing protein [Acidobacteriaceae bacterium]|nr:alpha-L-arabinofuranosidase C-terminal domain-containing protein [Acidobacteriaceae bacterium]
MKDAGFLPTRRQFAQGAGAAVLDSSLLARNLAGFDSPGAVAGELRIDVSAPLTPFNRMLFGQFLEHFHRQVYGGVFDPGSPLSDHRGFRIDVIEALRELKIPVVRWPGGCFASAYHWRDGVGDNRQPALDKAWGVEDPNTFGTAEFVEWCRRIGAAPYICTNAGTGTQEEMSDWVEYCNLKDQGRYARMRRANGFAEPFDVRYWSIGNENYLGGEIGAKTVEEWAPLVRESAKMMRAVDSGLKILAAATVNGNWTPPMLKAAGKYLDYISIHGYWDPLWQRGTKPSDYLHCMARCEQPEQQIRQAVELLEQVGFGDRIGIAFDEWNLRGWHHPGFPGGGADQVEMIRERDENDRNETYTMADALFSASFLNACLRNAKHVQMACMAPVVNARGPLFVHPRGIVKRTTFYVLRMYSDRLQRNVVSSQVGCGPLRVDQSSVAALDGLATCSDDRRQIAVALVNRHPDQVARWKMDFGSGINLREATVTILAGGSPDDYNDVAHPERVVPQTHGVTFENGLFQQPAHSIALLQASL